MKMLFHPKKKTPVNDPARNARKRIRRAEIIVFIIPICLIAFFGGKYLVMPHYDDTYAETRRAIIYDDVSAYAVEGDYYDRNGQLIFGNAEAGTGGTAASPMNESYAYLLGYYNASNNSEYAYGLRGNLVEYTWLHLDSEDKGATVTLTTDNDLQNYAYELLNGLEGSITVIDNDTGAILCLASHSTITYDVNNPDDFLSNDTADAQYRRGTYETDPPGSTFKVITAAAAIQKANEEGYGDDWFQYYDTGTYTAPGDTWTVTNYGDAAYGDLDLDTAMANSVNCYFANLGVQTGADDLKAMAEKFMIGQDIEIPYLCTLHSSLDIESDNLGTVAQTAFGQGNTEITPVHLCLVASVFGNSGVMMQPYIVSTVKGQYYDYVKAEPKVLSQVIEDDSVVERVRQAMHAAALTYGFDEADYGMVYAKTGTAECAGDRIHSYMIGCTDNYSFCVSYNTMSSSEDLYETALDLVSYLNANGFNG
jgi:cell division protein FtsI/penicillin-binding protein 2